MTGGGAVSLEGHAHRSSVAPPCVCFTGRMPRSTAPTRRIRLRALAVAAACVGLGLLAQLGRTPVLDLAGSVLYVVLLGMIGVIAAPRLPAWAIAIAALAAAAAVELLQLTALPDVVGGILPASRLVLGNAFDPVDLLAYVGGTVLLFLLLRLLLRDAASSPAASQPGALP